MGNILDYIDNEMPQWVIPVVLVGLFIFAAFKNKMFHKDGEA